MMKTYKQFAWRMVEWRKDPHCRKCGKEMHIYPLEGLRWQDQATVDHIISRGMGGSDEEDNYQLLCAGCNNKKSRSENPPPKKISITIERYTALIKRSELLDALRKEGIKNLPIWEAAQLRLKNSLDNS
jgi:hypothetical protein